MRISEFSGVFQRVRFSSGGMRFFRIFFLRIRFYSGGGGVFSGVFQRRQYYSAQGEGGMGGGVGMVKTFMIFRIFPKNRHYSGKGGIRGFLIFMVFAKETIFVCQRGGDFQDVQGFSKRHDFIL